MEATKIGIVCCSALQPQVKKSLVKKQYSYKIYPMIPSCTFTVNIGLFKHYLDKSIAENDTTILAYGICHPKLNELMKRYEKRVVRVSGDNCWEIMTGTEKYSQFLDKGYWMQSKPFLTRWREETLHGFGAGSKNGQLLLDGGKISILYLNESGESYPVEALDEFSKLTSLPYQIIDTNPDEIEFRMESAISGALSVTSHFKRGNHKPKSTCPEAAAIIENLDVIVYKMDVHTKEITYVSSQVQHILGFSPGEFIQLYNDFGSIPVGNDLDRQRLSNERWNFLVRCVAKGFQKSFEAEFTIKHKDGRNIWVLEKLNPTYSQDGTVEYFVGIIEDISHRKKAEVQLGNLYKNEMELRTRLEAQITSRTESTRALVHELKTPLTAIMAATDIISNAPLHDPYSNLVKQIELCANHLNRRIDEMLDLTRGEVGVLTLNYGNVDMAQLLQEMIECMKVKANETRQILTLEMPQKLPSVWADEERLRQVLFNLLSNAINYTNENGEIRLSCNVDDNTLIVHVSDNGCGISQEELPRIFNPYCQIKTPIKKSGGLGLGLALSKILIQLHNGKIWVESTLGKGSTFSFSIPLIDH